LKRHFDIHRNGPASHIYRQGASTMRLPRD
jgi:hypothetical protein